MRKIPSVSKRFERNKTDVAKQQSFVNLAEVLVNQPAFIHALDELLAAELAAPFENHATSRADAR